MTWEKKKPPDGNQVRQLRDLLERAGASPPPVHFPRIPTGCPALDQLLPEGGWLRGSLVEWLSDSPGSGAGTLALVAAREVHSEGGAVVVIDRTGTFYPPAAAAWRLDLASTIVLHPATDKDEQWALDQALRCEHTAAVLAWPRQLDGRTFRRLQLAAEASGAVGLLVRPATAEREPSWADVRLAVTPQPCAPNRPQLSEPGRPRPQLSEPGRPRPQFSEPGRPRPRPLDPQTPPRASPDGWQLCVRLLRSRGRFGKNEGQVIVEIDERTGDVHEASPRHLAAQLAYPAIAHRQA